MTNDSLNDNTTNPALNKENEAMEQTVKCHICGKPYKFYAFSAADQTACPKCVREAEENR